VKTFGQPNNNEQEQKQKNHGCTTQQKRTTTGVQRKGVGKTIKKGRKKQRGRVQTEEGGRGCGATHQVGSALRQSFEMNKAMGGTNVSVDGARHAVLHLQVELGHDVGYRQSQFTTDLQIGPGYTLASFKSLWAAVSIMLRTMNRLMALS
jgi:hypothetical protein